MITLAIDTSEARGSVALLHGAITLARRTHCEGIDYSGWLLPAVQSVLAETLLKMEKLDLLAVATGPGSFTGLRVGLTTVKAWAEVYRKPIVGVSRLEALARSAESDAGFVAASYDAQRGQLFGAHFRRTENGAEPIMEESVMPPEEFVDLANRLVGNQPLTWACLDPQMIENLEGLRQRTARGDRILGCSPELASIVGVLGAESAARGRFGDPLTLDANYVRRSDAEIFWKETFAGAR
jgi:tRNA threonylcarbamoyl adenosine modification protein YeaZ